METLATLRGPQSMEVEAGEEPDAVEGELEESEGAARPEEKAPEELGKNE